MSSKHENIKWMVIKDWSLQKRGRLYCMNQGLAVPMNSDNPIWFGPLNRNFKGFSDAFGFEYMPYSTYINYQYREMKVPVFASVEVKTKNDKVRPEQVDFLNYIIQIGGRAYVARESGDSYELIGWEVR